MANRDTGTEKKTDFVIMRKETDDEYARTNGKGNSKTNTSKKESVSSGRQLVGRSKKRTSTNTCIKSRCLPGQTYLVYIRSNSCHQGFVDDACFNYYLVRLLNSLNTFHIHLHAYVFLANEIYLLATPGLGDAISSLGIALNDSYSEYFNSRFDRGLRVWSDRIETSLVQGNALVLDCQKYLERLPLGQGKTVHPGAYRWSSYCANSFGLPSPYLTAHRSYLDFVRTNGNAYSGYRNLVSTAFENEYENYLDSRLRHGRTLAKRHYQLARPIAIKRRHFNLDLSD